jgi:REP element-mobilizing transposase RayT
MPDHFHGVIFIDNIRFQIDEKEVKKDNLKNNIGGCTGNKNPMLHENISHIIRWYKGRCTYEIKKMQKNFAWQSRFYDHIIRNEQSFERIQHYIAKNPENWKVKKKI